MQKVLKKDSSVPYVYLLHMDLLHVQKNKGCLYTGTATLRKLKWWIFSSLVLSLVYGFSPSPLRQWRNSTTAPAWNTALFIIPKPTEDQKKNQLFFSQPTFWHVVVPNVISGFFYLKQYLRIFKEQNRKFDFVTSSVEAVWRKEIKCLQNLSLYEIYSYICPDTSGDVKDSC